MFLLESFEWLHWWHGHDEVRRVAREIGRHGGFGMQKIEEKIYNSYSWSLS